MRVQHVLKVATLALGATLGPSLFAASYTWTFTGSGGDNCTGPGNSCLVSDAGNSIAFLSSPSGGPTVKATAWYINDTGQFQKAVLGRYSSGLGVCYPGESCSNPNHQTDNVGAYDFVLFEFSSLVDPTIVRVQETTSGTGDTDASYWLGGNPGQNLDLTGTTVLGLAGLGFGSQVNDEVAGNQGDRNVSITPSGSYVNKLLFGARYGSTSDRDDYFKIRSMQGDTPTTTTFNTAPEPSSVILLGTVGLVALHLVRKRARRA